MDAIKISTARIVFALLGLASIASAQTTPSFAALTPASGGAQYGAAQNFAFTFSDSAGASDIIQAQIGFGSISTASNCMVTAAPNGTVNLWNDAGSGFTSGSIGTGVLSNSQCSVNLAASSIGSSGPFLINLSVTFSSAYAGTRQVYVTAAGSGGSSPWTIAGTWNVTTQMTVSATPSTGTGTSQTLTVTANDPSGVSDIYSLQVIVGASPTAAGSCYIWVFPNANTNNEGWPANSIWLATDSGGWSSPATLGSATTLSNSQCSVTVQSSSGVTSGSNYTLTLSVNYAPSYWGAQTVFALTNSIHSSAWNTGWVAASQWNVPANVLSQPQSVTPSTGNLAAQTFTFTYSDSAGINDYRGAMVKFGSTTADAGSCYIWVNPNAVEAPFPANSVWLVNDANTSWGSYSTLGAAATLSNSQCSVDLAHSSASSTSNTLTLTLAVTFPPAYAGPKNIYGMAESYAANGAVSGWLKLGTWNVPGGVLTQSVAQSNPGTASQTLTFTYTDPRGAGDLASVQALIGTTSASTANSCYIWVNPNANTWPAGVLWLLNDAGNWGSYYALGTSGTISNSQCSINLAASSATANGTTYTLKLAVTYTSLHAAPNENIYGTMTDAIGDTIAWQLLDVWRMPVPAITNISPSPGVTGSTVTITGTNFGLSGGTVTINGLAASALWGPASITATVPAAATTGNVVVTSALGLASNGFNLQVVPPPPTLTGLNPSSATLGEQPKVVTLTGTNFVAPVIHAGSGISVTNMNVLSSSQITATVAANGAVGTNAITVTTPGGATASLPYAIHPAPSLSQSTPGSASQMLTFTLTDTFGTGDLVSAQALIGSSIQSTANSCYIWVNPNLNQWPANSIWLQNDAGNSWGSYYALGTSGTISNSQCSIDLGASSATANGATYTLNLAVTYKTPCAAASENVYGTMTTASGDAPAWQQLGVWGMPIPAIANISPNPGLAGSQVTITGANFCTSAGTVTFNGAAASTAWGPISLTATVPGAATSGNVVVTSAVGLASNGVNFTVVPPPTLTSMSRSSAALGDPPTTVILTGTNFVAPVTINAGSGISVSNASVVNANQITAIFTITAVQVGTIPITVTTPAGTSGSLPFTINPTPTQPIATVPSGLTVIVDTVAYTTPASVPWAAGAQHSVSVATQGTGGTQNVFSSWSDGGAATHLSTAPASSTPLTATFTTQYYLTTATMPASGGGITPASGWVNAATSVTVAATPAAGYMFTGLTGTASSPFTMTAPVSVTANFAPSFTLTVTPVAGTLPASIAMAGGTGAGYTVQLTRLGGFSGGVTITPQVPPGFQANFTTQSGTVSTGSWALDPGTDNPTATMTISAPKGAVGNVFVGVTAATTSGASVAASGGALAVQDYTLQLTPVSTVAPWGLSLAPGTSGAWTLVIQGLNGFNRAVDVASATYNLDGSFVLPGISARCAPPSFSVDSALPGQPVQVNITAPTNIVPNSPFCGINVIGSSVGAGSGHYVLGALNVNPNADFTLLPVGNQSAAPGGQATFTLGYTAFAGFSSPVTFSASGLPAGVTASSAVSQTQSSPAQMQVSVVPGVTPKTYQFTVTATAVVPAGCTPNTSGCTTLIHPEHAWITVGTGGPGFSLTTVATSAQPISSPGAATYSVTVNSSGGYTGSVLLTASGGPPGATITLNGSTGSPGGAVAANVAAGSTVGMTVSAPVATPAQSYAISLTASSGGVTQSGSTQLAVAPGSVPASIISPLPGQLPSVQTQTFSIAFAWNSGVNVAAYQLNVVGNGGYTFSTNLGTAQNYTLNGIPTGASPLTVALSSQIEGAWSQQTYLYTLASVTPVPLGTVRVRRNNVPVILQPALSAGATITGCSSISGGTTIVGPAGPNQTIAISASTAVPPGSTANINCSTSVGSTLSALSIFDGVAIGELYAQRDPSYPTDPTRYALYIDGNGFGDSQGQSFISVNGAQEWGVTGWGDTQITVSMRLQTGNNTISVFVEVPLDGEERDPEDSPFGCNCDSSSTQVSVGGITVTAGPSKILVGAQGIFTVTANSSGATNPTYSWAMISTQNGDNAAIAQFCDVQGNNCGSATPPNCQGQNQCTVKMQGVQGGKASLQVTVSDLSNPALPAATATPPPRVVVVQISSVNIVAINDIPVDSSGNPSPTITSPNSSSAAVPPGELQWPASLWPQPTRFGITPGTAVVLVEYLHDVAVTVTSTPPATDPDVTIAFSAPRDPTEPSGIGAQDALPTLKPNPGQQGGGPLPTGANTRLLALNQKGSFQIVAYIDSNANGQRDDNETGAAVPLVLVNVSLVANLSNANSSHVDWAPPGVLGETVAIQTGSFSFPTPTDQPSAMYLGATVDFFGGGPDGQRGVKQVFAGWVNNEVAAETTAGTYVGPRGTHSINVIFDGTTTGSTCRHQ
jgi:hypothetical protein